MSQQSEPPMVGTGLAGSYVNLSGASFFGGARERPPSPRSELAEPPECKKYWVDLACGGGQSDSWWYLFSPMTKTCTGLLASANSFCTPLKRESYQASRTSVEGNLIASSPNSTSPMRRPNP